MHAKIQAVYLPALAQFAAKQDIRYYLNGFLIEPAPANIGGVFLVATDGHTGCFIHDPEGTSDGIYNMQVPRLLLGQCKPGDEALGIKRVTFDGHMATVGDDTGPILAEKCLPIDGKFPDWRRILPAMPMNEGRLVSCIALNPSYLARGYAALKAMGIKKASSASIELFPGKYKDSSTIFVPRTTDEHRIFFIIMPMRGGGDFPERMNWITGLTERWEPPAADAPADINTDTPTKEQTT